MGKTSTKTFTVTVNGEAFTARLGDFLLDAALLSGIDLPHDCRSGHCGTCRVRILDGWVFGGEDPNLGTVRACQCRIISDLHVEVEDMPAVDSVAGQISKLTPLASDVVEVTIEPSRPIPCLPGQYLQVQFRKFPTRSYSPTVPLDRPNDGRIRLHIRRVPDGKVSSALDREILEGHRVRLSGPFGSAFLRPGMANRLVLVGCGTGFAPIWSIADAAMHEDPGRQMVLVVGARSVETLYMIRALCRLAYYPNVRIIPVVNEPHNVSQVIRTGWLTDFIPQLYADDTVYAAGGPSMVDAVVRQGESAGAVCYADPFVSKADEVGLLTRAMSWLQGETRVSSPLTVPAITDQPHGNTKPRLVSDGRAETPERTGPKPATRPRRRAKPSAKPKEDALLQTTVVHMNLYRS